MEVFSFAKLVTHYKEHEKANLALSFVEFLYMHYASDDGNTADDNEDRKLPFHHVNIHSLTTLFWVAQPTSDMEKSVDYCFNNTLLGNRFKIYIQKNYIPTLLHPPRYNA